MQSRQNLMTETWLVVFVLVSWWVLEAWVTLLVQMAAQMVMVLTTTK
jgi:hypothetical protein